MNNVRFFCAEKIGRCRDIFAGVVWGFWSWGVAWAFLGCDVGIFGGSLVIWIGVE